MYRAENQKLYAINAQLLEAMEDALWYINQLEMIVYSSDDDGEHEIVSKAKAAIESARRNI